MTDRKRRTCFLICLALVACIAAQAQTPSSNSKPSAKEQKVSHATGSFEVKLSPQQSDPPIGRMAIEKQWQGGLVGTSKGEMLASGSGSAGSSGGYVALEQFTGTLNGRKGTFILQHSATMTRGTPQLTIKVVPDSGTDELVGLTGQLKIAIAEGKHSYKFRYTLPEAK
jgi:hypothetical protein